MEKAVSRTSLYKWQVECHSKWFSNDCRGIVVAVTGAGKTMMAVRAAMKLKDKLSVDGERLSIRVAVPKTFLLSHWRAAFLREKLISRPDIGLWCGAHKDVPLRPITLYVLNSARYALARHIMADIEAGLHVLLIVDECHHLSGGKNAKILEFVPKLGERSKQYHALALSATAESVINNISISDALGGVIYRYGLSQALLDGVISNLLLFPVAVSFKPSEYIEYESLCIRLVRAVSEVKKLYPILRGVSGAEFFAALQSLVGGEKRRVGDAASAALRAMRMRREMMHLAENRIQCACELARGQPPDSRIILFCERIACAKLINSRLDIEFPGRTAIYHSGMGAEPMKAALSRYLEGEARILITCRALDEGLDIPETDVGIAVSSTRAERQRIQRLGRILRRRRACGPELPAKLYYIYLDKSSEEKIYLERNFPFPIIPLSYGEPIEGVSAASADAGGADGAVDTDSDGFRNGFRNAEFESLAKKVVTDLGIDNLSDGRRAEFNKQAAMCLLRGDFRLSEKICEGMRPGSRSQSERNYWTVAALLAAARL